MSKNLPTKIWNLSQNLLSILNQPPRACHYPRSPIFCSGCEPGAIFECKVCGRLMPYCMGADDDLPDACDDCWSKAHREDFQEVIKIDQQFSKLLSKED
jgi:hypothetical protein